MTEAMMLLAERCEAATGPDRELDVAIHCAKYPEHKRHKSLVEYHSGHRETVEEPRYTASLDAAMSLVPEGWYWRAGHGVLWVGWAHLNRKHPDHCDRGDEHSAHAETPALALCAAALRARATHKEQS